MKWPNHWHVRQKILHRKKSYERLYFIIIYEILNMNIFMNQKVEKEIKLYKEPEIQL